MQWPFRSRPGLAPACPAPACPARPRPALATTGPGPGMARCADRLGAVRLSPPDPPLSDGIVELRPWREDDVDAIVRACRDDDIARWLDQVPQPYTRADARDWVTATARGWRDG